MSRPVLLLSKYRSSSAAAIYLALSYRCLTDFGSRPPAPKANWLAVNSGREGRAGAEQVARAPMHRSGQLRSSVGTQTVPAAADSNEDLAYEPPPVDDDVDVAFLASQARRLATFRAESRLTDLVVCVGAERFACHRLHLCAASSFFRALFTSAMRDASSESITLEEIAPSVFGTVLEYVYTGHCTLTADDVVDVLAAADRLAVIELRERCTRFLQRNLTAQNALAAYDVASSLSITRLKESALRVALEQFDEVAASPSFVDVPADFLKQLFASDELRAAEECVFRALSAWYHHQLDERVDDASALLQLVRLPLCEPAFLEVCARARARAVWC